MLRAVLNKSWKQHPTIQPLYGHLLYIFQTSEHAEHSWRCKDRLINEIILWIPADGRTSAG